MIRLIALMLIAPTAALAHTGAHDFSSLPHLVSEPDHLGMIALGLAVVAGAYGLNRRAAQRRAARIRAAK